MKASVDMSIDRKLIRKRTELFLRLNKLISEAGGWTTSVPGATKLRFEVIPGNALPDILAEAGWQLTSAGDGERIISGAIQSQLRNAKGQVYLTTSHPGIVQTQIWELCLP
jgi:hypothetical protein